MEGCLASYWHNESFCTLSDHAQAHNVACSSSCLHRLSLLLTESGAPKDQHPRHAQLI